MATVADICNMALSYLGDQGTVTSIDPPEGSAQADHCARFYPIALTRILSETAWSFATKRENLSELVTPPIGAEYAYAYPSDCVNILSLHDESGRPIRRFRLERSAQAMAILTDVPATWIRYTTTKTPCELFPMDFSDALSHLLAAKLAGAMITGSTGSSLAEEQQKIYMVLLKDAIRRDALTDRIEDEPRTPYSGDMRLPSDEGGRYGF